MFSIMGSVLGKKSKSHGGLWENSFQEKLRVQLAISHVRRSRFYFAKCFAATV